MERMQSQQAQELKYRASSTTSYLSQKSNALGGNSSNDMLPSSGFQMQFRQRLRNN